MTSGASTLASQKALGPLIAAMKEQSGAEVAAAYVGCLVLGFLMLHHVAAWQWSSILTIATFFQCLSLVMLGIQLSASKSAKGLSLKTVYLHATFLCCRLSTTLFLEGYLPLDASR